MTIDIGKDYPTQSTVFTGTNDVGIEINRELFPGGPRVFIPSGKKNFGTRDYGGVATKGEVSKTFNFIKFNLSTFADSSNSFEITPEKQKQYLQVMKGSYNTYAKLLRSGLFSATGKKEEDFEAIYMVVRNNEFLFNITGKNTITKENFAKFMVFQAKHVIGFPKKKEEVKDVKDDPLGNLRFSSAMIMKLNKNLNDFEPAYYGKSVEEIKNLRHNLLISALSYLQDNDANIKEPDDIYFLKTEFYGGNDKKKINSYYDKIRPHYVYLGFLYGSRPQHLPVLESKYGVSLKWYDDDYTISAAIYVDAFEPDMYEKIKFFDHHYTLRETFRVEELTQEEKDAMQERLENMPEDEQQMIIDYLEESKTRTLSPQTGTTKKTEVFVNGEKVELTKEEVDELKKDGGTQYVKESNITTKFEPRLGKVTVKEPNQPEEGDFGYVPPIERYVPEELLKPLDKQQVTRKQALDLINNLSTGASPSGATTNNILKQVSLVNGHIGEKKCSRKKDQLIRLIAYL